jgi:hypothetical protein
MLKSRKPYVSLATVCTPAGMCDLLVMASLSAYIQLQ